MSRWRLGAAAVAVALSLVNGLQTVRGPLDALGGALLAVALLAPARRPPGPSRPALRRRASRPPARVAVRPPPPI